MYFYLTVVDQCASNPCQNSGYCDQKAGVLGYTCFCKDYYVGNHCETSNVHFLFILLLYILHTLNKFRKFQKPIWYLSRNVFPVPLFQRFKISVNLILVRMVQHVTQIQKLGNTNVHVLLNTLTQTVRPVSVLISVIIVNLHSKRFIKADLLINFRIVYIFSTNEITKEKCCRITFHFLSSFFPIEIQPCDSNPCLNGGTCSDATDGQSYTCNCIGDFTGINCQAGGFEMNYWSNECKYEFTIVWKSQLIHSFIHSFTFYRNRALCNRSLSK